MATETELERLVVKLTGDSKNYQRMLDNAIAETQTYADKIGRLHDKASGKFVAGQKRMQSAAEITGRALKKLGSGMRRLGMQASLRLTAPLALIGGMAVRSFGKFDQAMTESTSIMKVTEGQMHQMQETAIGLSFSGAVLQGPTDLAKSYFYLASAGKNAEQSMSLLPKVSAFATAGAFDMALATDLLTDAQSALGLASKNVAKDTQNLVKVSDVLVGANTLANASVQQFATALTSKAGAAFKAYNIRLEEGVALLAAYADQGIKAELAGNAADRMIRLLTKAARDNAGEFRKLGVRVFDARGEFLSFKKIIGSMEKALKGMSTEQKAAALTALGFEARVQSVILPLLGTSGAIGEYVKKLDRMGGITEEVSSKQMKSFANQMKVFWNQIKIVGIEIGQILAPWIQKLGKFVQAAAVQWKEFSPWVKKAWVVVGLLVAALGPLLIGAGSISFLAGQTILATKALWGFQASMASSTLGAVALKAALLGIVGVGIAAFVIAVRIELARLNEEVQKSTDKLSMMQESRIKSIKGLEGEEQVEAIKREGAKRLKAVRQLQRQIEAEKDKYRMKPGSFGNFAVIARRAARGIFGADTGAPLQRLLEGAKKDLKAFQKEFAKEPVIDLLPTIEQSRKTAQNWFAGLKTLVNQLMIKGMRGTSWLIPATVSVLKPGIEKQVKSQKKRIAEIAAYTEKLMTPQEKYNKEVAKLKELFPEGGEIYQRGITAAQKALDDLQDKAHIEISFKLVEGTIWGSAKAQQELNKYMSLRGRAMSKQGGREATRPSRIKDLQAPAAMGVGGATNKLPSIADGIWRLVEIGEDQLEKPGLEDVESAGLG